MSGPEGRVPLFIATVTEIGGEAILRAVPGVDRAAAFEVAQRIALDICARYAKTEMYIPEAAVLTRHVERNQRIWDDYGRDGPGPNGARRYTGARVEELATEHNLTGRQIHAILSHVRRVEARKRQHSLPGFDLPA